MEIYNWVLGVEWKDDWLIWDTEIPRIDIMDREIYEYNQFTKSENRKSCTLFSCFWAISDLFNYKFSEEEIKELNKISYEQWRTKWKWRYLFSAVDLVREYRNTYHPKQKVISFRLSSYSEKHLEALEKWHTCPTVYRGNWKYNKDKNKEWYLNWTKFWKSTYWHAVWLRNTDKTWVKDSSYGSKWNKYALWNYKGLIGSAVYSGTSYLFVPEEKLSESKKTIKLKQLINKTIEINSHAWILIDKQLKDTSINRETKWKIHEATEAMRNLDFINK